LCYAQGFFNFREIKNYEKPKTSIHLIVFLLAWSFLLIGQKRYVADSERFNAEVTIGFNASQLEGDFL